MPSPRPRRPSRVMAGRGARCCDRPGVEPTAKIAVLVVHGVGDQRRDFADRLERSLCARVAIEAGIAREEAARALAIERVHWGPIVQGLERALWQRIHAGQRLRYRTLRRFLVDYAADAIAYQRNGAALNSYDAIQRRCAEALHRLAERAGPDAPLCIIAHSLGSVIVSDFVWDLQKHARGEPSTLSASARATLGTTPIESAQTFMFFYTLASPIAFWTLRFDDFGTPIGFPPPDLATRFPRYPSEWVNFFDPDDVIGTPLRGLSPAYAERVAEDVAVTAGGHLIGSTPLAHGDHVFWVAPGIVERIGARLASAWLRLEGREPRRVPAWRRGVAAVAQWGRRVSATADLLFEVCAHVRRL